jgi:hypothetical protein
MPICTSKAAGLCTPRRPWQAQGGAGRGGRALGGLGGLGSSALLRAQVGIQRVQHGVARDDVGHLVKVVARLQHRLQVALEPGARARSDIML